MKKRFLIILFSLVAFGFLLEDSLPELKMKLKAYREAFQPVTLKLDFSQPKYAVGDTIFFRATYLNPEDRSFVKGKNIVNISLTSSKGEVISRYKLAIQDGIGAGAIPVDAKTGPGVYTLTAYTNWMRNFSSEAFFKASVQLTDNRKLEIAKDGETRMCRFKIHGSSLVQGLDNDLEIIGSDLFAEIIGEIKIDDEIVQQIRFDESGRVKCSFKPSRAGKYFLETKLANGIKKFELPEVFSQGIAINTSQPDPASPIIRAEITASNFSGGDVTLVVNSYGTIIYSANVTLADDKPVDVLIPLKNHSSQATLTIFNGQNVLTTSEIFANEKSDFKVNIDLSSSNFSTRQLVNASIQLADLNGSVTSANCAVRIIHEDLFKEENVLALDHLFYSSRMQPEIIHWNNWNKILSNDTKPEFFPEKYLRLSGKAILAETGAPVRDSTLLMFFFKNGLLGYETYAFDGRFNFPIVYDFYGNDNIFYAASLRGKDLNGVSVTLDSAPILNEANQTSPSYNPITSADPYGTYSRNRDIINKSFSFYERNKSRTPDDPNSAIEEELDGADVEVKLKDFVVFPTMSDVIKEILPAVDYRRIGGRDVIRVYTTNRRPTNFTGPVYVIDGILTKDPGEFLNLNPEEVISIKIVKDSKKLLRFGSLFSNGAILVRTNNTTHKDKISQANTLAVHGLLENKLQLPASPKATMKSNVPDLRACLYWNPQLIIDDTGNAHFSFYTSDDLGSYKIQVDGLSSDGRFFTAEKTFSVSLKPQ
jgi:hypothetical protein